MVAPTIFIFNSNLTIIMGHHLQRGEARGDVAAQTLSVAVLVAPQYLQEWGMDVRATLLGKSMKKS